MPVLIRRMSEADSSNWANMRFKLWGSLPIDEHLGDTKKMLKGGKRTGYIALLPNKMPAGFAEICIREYANGCTKQPVPFLEGIWITPKHRRSGIGRALIDKKGFSLCFRSHQMLIGLLRSRHGSWTVPGDVRELLDLGKLVSSAVRQAGGPALGPD